jgi:DNA replication protein DnaC
LARYECASLIVTSNKPFGRWGEVFALKGENYQLRTATSAASPRPPPNNHHQQP